MVTTETDIIVNSIRLVVEEEDYFEDYSLDFQVFSEGLWSSFFYFKGIDQNFVGYSKMAMMMTKILIEIAVFATEFAKYCKTDLQLVSCSHSF